jgi:hypothetical protein
MYIYTKQYRPFSPGLENRLWENILKLPSGAKNKQGETALDIARRKNLADIIAILENPPPVLSQVDRPPVL